MRELNRVIEHGTDEGKDWATNQLAWVLATCPDLAVRDVPRALELANQAVERDPVDGSHWNTLGVAQYRAGDLTAAVTSLNKSLQLGDAAQAENLLFLAMAHWQLGHPDEARQSYDMAARWMTDKKSTGEELLRFEAEAEVTLGIDPETPILETRNGPSVEAIISTEKPSQGDPPTSSDDP